MSLADTNDHLQPLFAYVLVIMPPNQNPLLIRERVK